MSEKKESRNLIEVKEITFNDSTLIAIKKEDGKIYASVKNFCDELGIDFSGQLQKLKKHKLLKKRIGGISIPTKGGIQDVTCIEIKSIALWLATISPSKIKEEMQDRFEIFLEKVEEVLAKEFLNSQNQEQPKFKIPSYSEALRLLADNIEKTEKIEGENKKLVEQNQALGSQVSLLKVYTDTTELKTLRQIGYKLKPYGLGPTKIFTFLRENKVLAKAGGENYPTSKFTNHLKIEHIIKEWIDEKTGEVKSKAFDVLKAQPSFYKFLAELLVNQKILTINQFNQIDFNQVPNDENCYDFSPKKAG